MKKTYILSAAALLLSATATLALSANDVVVTMKDKSFTSAGFKNALASADVHGQGEGYDREVAKSEKVNDNSHDDGSDDDSHDDDGSDDDGHDDDGSDDDGHDDDGSDDDGGHDDGGHDDGGHDDGGDGDSGGDDD